MKERARIFECVTGPYLGFQDRWVEVRNRVLTPKMSQNWPKTVLNYGNI